MSQRAIFGKSDRHGRPAACMHLWMTTCIILARLGCFRAIPPRENHAMRRPLANTKSTPELWLLRQFFGTDMTAASAQAAVRRRRGGYSARFSEREEILPDREQTSDWLLPQRERRRLEWHERRVLRRENAHAWRGNEKRPMTTMQQPRYRDRSSEMSFAAMTSGRYYSRRTAAFTS